MERPGGGGYCFLPGLRCWAKQGNTYAQKESRKLGLAELAIGKGQTDTAELSAQAVGKMGDTLEAVADHASWGAQKNLRRFAQTGDASELGGAGLRVGAGACQAVVEEVVGGKLLQGGAAVLGVGARVAVRASKLKLASALGHSSNAVSSEVTKAAVCNSATFLKPALTRH